MDGLTKKVNELSEYLKIVDIRSARNMAFVMNLEQKNAQLKKNNKSLKKENNQLKLQVKINRENISSPEITLITFGQNYILR